MDNLDFETLTADELKVFVDTRRERSFLLIDVRQPLEYERGHLPGARLMPLMEVEAKLFSLPTDRDLIFYCTNGGRSHTGRWRTAPKTTMPQHFFFPSHKRKKATCARCPEPIHCVPKTEIPDREQS